MNSKFKIGEVYRGRYFLGGDFYEEKLVEVYNGYACLHVPDGRLIEDINAYSLVSKNEIPPETNHLTLLDILKNKKK